MAPTRKRHWHQVRGEPRGVTRAARSGAETSGAAVAGQRTENRRGRHRGPAHLPPRVRRAGGFRGCRAGTSRAAQRGADANARGTRHDHGADVPALCLVVGAMEGVAKIVTMAEAAAEDVDGGCQRRTSTDADDIVNEKADDVVNGETDDVVNAAAAPRPTRTRPASADDLADFATAPSSPRPTWTWTRWGDSGGCTRAPGTATSTLGTGDSSRTAERSARREPRSSWRRARRRRTRSTGIRGARSRRFTSPRGSWVPARTSTPSALGPGGGRGAAPGSRPSRCA